MHRRSTLYFACDEMRTNALNAYHDMSHFSSGEVRRELKLCDELLFPLWLSADFGFLIDAASTLKQSKRM